MNACVALVHDSDLASIENLAKLLRQKGENDLALMLAQSLPSGVKSTRDLRLATAYVAGWWTRFERILTESKTDPACSLWRGHWFWRKGDKDGAREQWAAAGEIGKPWIVHADMTQQALRLIKEGDDDGLQKWAESEAKAPGCIIGEWFPQIQFGRLMRVLV